MEIDNKEREHESVGKRARESKRERAGAGLPSERNTMKEAF